MSHTIRCAVYTRKSLAAGLEQEFNTLDAQREACEHFAQAQGWSVLPARYDDGGFSGKDTDRPALQRLLRDAQRGKFDRILVYKLDRLSRSLIDFLHLMKTLEGFRIEFVSVTQNFSTADAIGRLTLQMLVSFAEFERAMISERTRDKVRAARKKGKWTGGPVPFGYALQEGRLVPHEHDAAVVRRIFASYLKTHSPIRIAQALQAEGVDTRRKGRDGGASRWSKQRILHILRNPLYVGLVRAAGDEVKGEHKGIIARETFDSVQERFSSRKASYAARPASLLQSLVRCAQCGATMTPSSSRSRLGHTYRYYRCVTKDRAGSRACAGRAVRADKLERAVVVQLGAIARSKRLSEELLERVEARTKHETKAAKACLRSGPAELAKLEAQFAALATERSSLPEDAQALATRRMKALAEQERALNEQVNSARLQLERLEAMRLDARWLARTLEDFERVWDVMTPQNQRRLVLALVQRVRVDTALNTVVIETLDVAEQRAA